MTTAYLSFSPISNGSITTAVAAHTEGMRQVGRLYTGAVSLSGSLSRDLKVVSIVLPLPFGCNIIPSKTWQKKSIFSVDALDLESGYGFGKESGFESETKPSFDSSEGLDFGSDSSFSSGVSGGFDKDETLGFGGNQNFGGGLNSYDSQSSIAPGNKLYVGNLPWSCDSQQLADVFEEAGVVDVVEVIYDKETGRSRGFGFITMASVEEAEKAITKLDGYQLGGRALRVSFPSARGGSFRSSGGFSSPGGTSGRNESGFSESNSKVYVGNLPWGVDDVTLDELFNACGSILEARVVYDRETGRSRGFGFVTFSSPNEANQAISELNGSNYEGRPLRVNLAGEKPAMRF